MRRTVLRRVWGACLGFGLLLGAAMDAATLAPLDDDRPAAPVATRVTSTKLDNQAVSGAKITARDTASPSEPATVAGERVAWKGPVAHIFFHSLVVYPQLAFTGDRQSGQFKDYMITRDQFVNILDQLYANDYVLIDMGRLYDVDADGKVNRRELLVPKGKKPLVVSLDDLSYYEYMRGRGFAEKLVLDGAGEVATQVVSPQGETLVTRTGDAVPILDDFVRRHPDFSLDGAKGVIALTGYEGVLGYRTQVDVKVETTPAREALRAVEQTAARPVIARLKATGWRFASHSYSHNNRYRRGNVGIDKVAIDLVRWQDEVGSLVGPTDIFIGPFGQVFKPGDVRRGLLLDAGFKVLCGVGIKPMLAYHDSFMQMDRANIDGYRIDRSAKRLKPYFDVASIGGRGVGEARRGKGTAKAKKDRPVRSVRFDISPQKARRNTKSEKRSGKSRQAATGSAKSGRTRRAAFAIGRYRETAARSSSKAVR